MFRREFRVSIIYFPVAQPKKKKKRKKCSYVSAAQFSVGLTNFKTKSWVGGRKQILIRSEKIGYDSLFKDSKKEI